MAYNHNSNGGGGGSGSGSGSTPTSVDISNVVGGQYSGKSSTFINLPTTDLEGNDLKAGDIVFLTVDDIGELGTPQNPEYPRGAYEYNGTRFLLSFPIPLTPATASATIPISLTVGGAVTDVTSSGTFSGVGLSNVSTYDGSHVADGVLSDYGYLNTPTAAETTGVLVVFPTAVNLSKIQILMSATAEVFKSTGITVKGRLDASSPWVTLVSNVAFSNPVSGEYVDVPIGDTTDYLEYNILFTAGASTVYRACTELKMFSQTTSTITVQAYPYTAPDLSTWATYIDNSGTLITVPNP